MKYYFSKVNVYFNIELKNNNTPSGLPFQDTFPRNKFDLLNSSENVYKRVLL
jgi:hypothetical protein